MSILPLLAGSRRGRASSPPLSAARISIAISPASRTTPVDSVVTYDVTLTRFGGHEAATNLTIEGLPGLVGGSFSPSTLTGDTLQSVLSVTVGSSATPVVADSFTVRASSAGVDDATVVASLTITEPGNYAHFAPTAPLAQPLDGTGLSFNVNTGMVVGDIIDTSFIDRDWLIANADTVVTVKESGGDFVPSQYNSVLAAAGARNDLTVIVVDEQIELPGIDLPQKNAISYSAAQWTITVPAPWWNGTWTPSGNRYLRTSGSDSEAGNLYRISSRVNAPRAAIQTRAGQGSQYKYAFLGAEVYRADDAPTASFWLVSWNQTTSGTTPGQGLAFFWSWVNGRDPSPSGYTTTGGCFITNRAFVFEHSLVTGIAKGGTETKAFLLNPGQRWCQLRWSLGEAHSINFLTGGSPYTTPEQTPQDLWADMLLLPKRQTWNPSSPTYNGIGNQHKQGLEAKYGKRFTIQGLDIINCWMGIQRSGLTIQCTPQQAPSTRFCETKDIVIRHVRIQNAVAPFGISPSIAPPDNVIAQLGDLNNFGTLDVKNLLGLKGKNAQLNYGTSSYDNIRALSAPGLPTAPVHSLTGPIDWQWMTFAMPNDESRVSAMFRKVSASVDPDRQHDWLFTMRNVLMFHDYSSSGGFITEVVGTNYPTQVSGASVLDTMKLGGRGSVNIGKVFMVSKGTFRATFEANYPEQYEASNWLADLAGYGYVNPTSDPMEGNYRLSPTSPLKGLGDGGRDPGADIDLIEMAVGTLLADCPDYIPLAFPEVP